MVKRKQPLRSPEEFNQFVAGKDHINGDEPGSTCCLEKVFLGAFQNAAKEKAICARVSKKVERLVSAEMKKLGYAVIFEHDFRQEDTHLLPAAGPIINDTFVVSAKVMPALIDHLHSSGDATSTWPFRS